MLRPVREFGPVVLVPLAWLIVLGTHLDILEEEPLFIAHIVMVVFMAFFVLAGRSDMREGSLYVWWNIILVGLVVTLAGLVGFQIDTGGDILQAIALLGWMLLPAIGFIDTGSRLSGGILVYLCATAACVFGTMMYIGSLLTGTELAGIVALVVVGVGQTAAIADAALRR